MILPRNTTGKHVPATLRQVHGDSQSKMEVKRPKTCPYKLAKIATRLQQLQTLSSHPHPGNVKHALARYCTSSSGTATPYQARRGVIEGRSNHQLEHLKRNENASTVRFEILSAQETAIADKMTKYNNINMLAHRFNIAPMMDWTGRSQKAKHNQHLSLLGISHVVPNAVPLN
jgi:hypothetical protein